MGPRQGVVVVGLGFDKTDFLVEGTGGLHVAQRVQQHGRIARLLGAENHRVNQLPPQPVAAESGPHEQALHFTGVEVVAVGERPECAAAGGLTIDLGDKQPAMRFRILAR